MQHPRTSPPSSGPAPEALPASGQVLVDPAGSPVDTATLRSIGGNRSHRAGSATLTDLAAELSQRHGLPAELAAAVAAGRMTAAGALHLHLSRREASLAARAGRRHVLWLSIVAVALAAGLSYARWQRHLGSIRETVDRSAPSPATDGAQSPASAPTDRPASPGARAEVTFEEDGTLARIRGSSPLAVMEAFCHESGRCAGQFGGVSLERPAAGQPDIRYGLFVEASDPWRRQALIVRKDSRTRMWSVGDGDQVRAVDPAGLP